MELTVDVEASEDDDKKPDGRSARSRWSLAQMSPRNLLGRLSPRRSRKPEAAGDGTSPSNGSPGPSAYELMKDRATAGIKEKMKGKFELTLMLEYMSKIAPGVTPDRNMPYLVRAMHHEIANQGWSSVFEVLQDVMDRALEGQKEEDAMEDIGALQAEEARKRKERIGLVDSGEDSGKRGLPSVHDIVSNPRLCDQVRFAPALQRPSEAPC